MNGQITWLGNRDRLRSIWSRSLFPQIALIALGILVIVVSLPGWLEFSESGRHDSSLALVLTISCVLMIGGSIRLIDLYLSKRWNGFKPEIMVRFLYLLAGIVLLAYSHRAMVAVDLILSTYFAVEGMIRIFRSIELRSDTEICWLVCGTLSLIRSAALLSWILYISILFWALGLLSGIDLILDGCCRIVERFTASD